MELQKFIFSSEWLKNEISLNRWEERYESVNKDIDDYMGIKGEEFKERYIDTVNNLLCQLFWDFKELEASEKERCLNLLNQVRDKIILKLKLSNDYNRD